MGYIEFDKTQLINLEYSLKREIIRSNRSGSFASTTIIGCNTRKYHGLLICPMEDLDGGNHVLLSTLDETIIQRKKEFNLAIHRYPGIYSPKGHKYIKDYESEPLPSTIYRVGGVLLKKEMILSMNEERILVRYTLLDAHSPTKIRLKPFLAFRNVHTLSKANLDVNFRYKKVNNGIKLKMYDAYKSLFIQFSKKNEYVPVPQWYYDIEYLEELARGYDFREDLYVPGYFELPIRKGESVIFSAGLSEVTTQSLAKQFNAEIEKRVPRDNFENCLKNSSHQFIVKKEKSTEIVAGYPWFGRWGRDTFISLPGLALCKDDIRVCKNVIDTLIREMKNGLFPNLGSKHQAVYNSADTSLWFIWTIQQYADFIGNKAKAWKEYGSKIMKVINAYIRGTDYNIRMHDNGLIWAEHKGTGLTWMDAIVDGQPVTPRYGYAVDVNALWYNAICFAIDAARAANDTKTTEQLKTLPLVISHSFKDVFWDEKKKYLADSYRDSADWSVRPNQIFAAAFEYSPIDEEMRKAVLDNVERELLTPKGLRSLSPKNPAYIGTYTGDQRQRDLAYHQGTVWPWLLGFFAEAYLKIHSRSGVHLIEKLYHGFEEDMTYYGIGAIPELYCGDPPFTPGGALSQAWSTAAVIRMNYLVKKYKTINNENNNKKDHNLKSESILTKN